MKITDIEKWRCEIEIAEDFRDEEFGTYTNQKRTKAGENLEYYERGFADNLTDLSSAAITTINIIDSIVSIIVPSLSYKNPKTLAFPKKVESEDTAPLAGKILDHYKQRMGLQDTNQKITFDAYLLGYGAYKAGYATKFGKDIRDEEKEKERKSLVDRGLESLGLKKKKEEETTFPEMDLRIIGEFPFIEYISPFNFGIDPKALNLNEAMYWYHKTRKTVKELRDNPKYKNTKSLKGTLPEGTSIDYTKILDTEVEAFETVYLYEIHYRSDNKFYLLDLVKDCDGKYSEIYHDESIYTLEEWQADLLFFKQHGHALYPRSDITKVKNLQSRITVTVDAILEQVDKFVPKLAYDGTALGKDAENSLKYGGTGALIKCTGSPEKVFKELSFTQLKTDLLNLMEQFITLVSLQTGVTRAQLTGMSQSNTATEATLEQGGQTIRLSDMSEKLRLFHNHQSQKLWKIITQFVELEELELINGIKGIDEETGLPKYDWLTVSPDQAEKLRNGEYDFDIEVGSTQKLDLAVVRKSFENWVNILARTEVIALLQQQGKTLDLGDFIKKGFELFPELGIDSGKIIRNISQGTGGLIPEQTVQQILGGGKGGETTGSKTNEMRAQRTEPVPTMPNQIGASR